MLNVLGQYPDISAVLNIDGAHYHSYHKAEREDRKIAHITLMPNDVADLDIALAKLVAVLPNKVGLDKKLAPTVTENQAKTPEQTASTETDQAVEDAAINVKESQPEGLGDIHQLSNDQLSHTVKAQK
jgi:5-(carboxyamino)imidazole ribonucleotide synthase